MDTQALLAQLEERGLRAQVVSIRRVVDLQEAIARWHRVGILDEELHRADLSGFRFAPPEALPGARSLIVVANPQPALHVHFTHRGAAVPVVIPPTYVFRAPDEAVRGALTAALGPAGYRAEKANVPVKFLAVCSGLARYGRNNITYVAGMGSFQRLAAFASDLPCEDDAWQEPQLLEACARCTACLRRCPTGAIAADRFLLHAERCLTWHNERPPALPDWIDPDAHNALIGCMLCQRACPENRALLEWFAPGPEFTEDETALLLRGPAAAELPAETLAKLEAMDWGVEDLPVLARNLGLLIAGNEGTHG